MFDIREPSFAALQDAPIKFRYGSNRKTVLIDTFTASAIKSVHAVANLENQAKIERMVAGSFSQFERLVSFCFKVCK